MGMREITISRSDGNDYQAIAHSDSSDQLTREDIGWITEPDAMMPHSDGNYTPPSGPNYDQTHYPTDLHVPDRSLPPPDHYAYQHPQTLPPLAPHRPESTLGILLQHKRKTKQIDPEVKEYAAKHGIDLSQVKVTFQQAFPASNAFEKLSKDIDPSSKSIREEFKHYQKLFSVIGDWSDPIHQVMLREKKFFERIDDNIENAMRAAYDIMTLAAYYTSATTDKHTQLAELKRSILGPTNTIMGKTTYYLMYPLALAALCRTGGLAAGAFVRALGASPQTTTAGAAFLNASERVAAAKGGGSLMAAFSKVLPEIAVAGKAFFSMFKPPPNQPDIKSTDKEISNDLDLPPEVKDALQIKDIAVEEVNNIIVESTEQGVKPEDIAQDYAEMVENIANGGRPDKCFIRFKNQQGVRRYCIENNCTERSKFFGIKNARPLEVHHGIPHLHSKYTPEYESRLREKGLNLNLDSNWNKVKIPHRGPHPGQYHQWIINKLENILERVNYGDVNKFMDLYNLEVIEVIKEDFIICSTQGYK